MGRGMGRGRWLLKHVAEVDFSRHQIIVGSGLDAELEHSEEEPGDRALREPVVILNGQLFNLFGELHSGLGLTHHQSKILGRVQVFTSKPSGTGNIECDYHLDRALEVIPELFDCICASQHASDFIETLAPLLDGGSCFGHGYILEHIDKEPVVFVLFDFASELLSLHLELIGSGLVHDLGHRFGLFDGSLKTCVGG